MKNIFGEGIFGTLVKDEDVSFGFNQYGRPVAIIDVVAVGVRIDEVYGRD